MGRYVIGVDNGGTFIKAALYDEHGRMVSLAREASRTIIPEPGRVEINLNELWAINCRCIAQVLAESGMCGFCRTGERRICSGFQWYCIQEWNYILR